MCGRYTLTTLVDELVAFFQLPDGFPLFEPRFNIAPTQPILAVRATVVGAVEHPVIKRQPAFFHWGLVPSWSKHPDQGAKLINARAETLAEKPSFRNAFKRRRCLIPANGFYEWQTVGRKKRPLFIRMVRERLFAFAGLFEEWHGPNGELLETCAIVTTSANELMRPIHDRMPVILKPSDYDTWLNPRSEDLDELSHLLVPFSANEMKATPVDDFVNSVRNEGPKCIEPFREEPSLF